MYNLFMIQIIMLINKYKDRMDMEVRHIHIQVNIFQNIFLSVNSFIIYLACGSIVCRNGGICQYMGINGYQCQCDSSRQWLGNDCSQRMSKFIGL